MTIDHNYRPRLPQPEGFHSIYMRESDSPVHHTSDFMLESNILVDFDENTVVVGVEVLIPDDVLTPDSD